MKVEVIDWIKIETPRGKAKLENYTWSSNDKELEKELNALKAQMMSGFANLRRGTGVRVFDLDKGNIGGYDE